MNNIPRHPIPGGYRLGIDLGPTSIGWAIIPEDCLKDDPAMLFPDIDADAQLADARKRRDSFIAPAAQGDLFAPIPDPSPSPEPSGQSISLGAGATAPTLPTVGEVDICLDDPPSDQQVLAAKSDPLGMFPIRVGVRIFPEGVDRDTRDVEKSKNEARRRFRLMRRLHERSARRKHKLGNLLVQRGLLPADLEQRRELFRRTDSALLPDGSAPVAFGGMVAFGPFALRVRALDHPVSLHEFGRILIHLAQRRGFLSNAKQRLQDQGTTTAAPSPESEASLTAPAAKATRKQRGKGKDQQQPDDAAAPGENGEDLGKVKTSIDTIRSEMLRRNFRTYAEYLVAEAREKALPLRNRRPDDAARWPERSMLKQEFEALWNAQEVHHPQLRNDTLRREVFEAIFGQRPLKSQKEKVGKCELLHEKDRAPVALWEANHFRMLKEVNNLRISNPDGSERPLHEDERKLLVQELASAKTMSWSAIKKLLKLPNSDNKAFNLERQETRGLKGNEVEVALRSVFGHEIFTTPAATERAALLRSTVWPAALCALEGEDAQGDAYTPPALHPNDLAARKKKANFSITDPASAYTEKQFLADCAQRWHVDPAQARRLMNLAALMPEKHARYSVEAFRALIPHLETGKDEHASIEAAGLRASAHERKALDRLPGPPAIANPIVTVALGQLRKIVNLLIAEYGKPTTIVVELARETKGTSGERNDRLKLNREREDNRKRIAEELRKLGREPKRRNIEKYLLWEECEHCCPYTGKSICLDDLFGNNPQFDVEHIVPFSRSLDDSFANKTLCHKSANAAKRNQTPFEAFGETPEWERIQSRLLQMKSMPYNKRRKFLQKEHRPAADFIARQLVDTQYAARMAREFLQLLYEPAEAMQRVRTTRGQITADLRDAWGLNDILPAINPLLPGVQKGEKNRADHRHHAIDAAVIALTDARHLQLLSQRDSLKLLQAAIRGKRRPIPLPWRAFRRDLALSLRNTNVSYRALRNVRGGYHEDTNYGPVNVDSGEFVYRKALTPAITREALQKIRDPHVKEIVLAWVEKHGGDPKKAFKAGLPTLPNRKGQPIPIRRVRIVDTIGDLVPMCRPGEKKPHRYVKPGSNHHLSVFEVTEKGKKKRIDYVTRMITAGERAAENRKRLKQGKPVLPLTSRNHPDHPDAKFCYSLSINECFRCIVQTGDELLTRVQRLTPGQVALRPAWLSVFDKNDKTPLQIRISLNSLQGQKVIIDPIGREFPTND